MARYSHSCLLNFLAVFSGAKTLTLKAGYACVTLRPYVDSCLEVIGLRRILVGKRKVQSEVVLRCLGKVGRFLVDQC